MNWKLKWAFLIACRPSINFLHFHHFLQNHLANFNNLNTKHPWVKGIQVCPNEGSRPFPMGRWLCKSENELTKFKNLLLHNYVIAENLKIFLSHRANISQALHKASFGNGDSNEEPWPFPRGDNYEIAKLHWQNMKSLLQNHKANFNQI